MSNTLLPTDNVVIPLPNSNNSVSTNTGSSLKGGGFENVATISNDTAHETSIEAPTTPPEKEKVQEIFKQPVPMPTALKDDPNNNQAAPIPPIQETKPKVVDKKTNKERLHKVGPKADSITTLADKEEEEFINEVEKHHINQ